MLVSFPFANALENCSCLTADTSMLPEISSGLIQLMNHPRSAMIVNSGDPKPALEKAHSSVMGSLYPQNPSMPYFFTWDGGAGEGRMGSANTISDIQRVSDWPEATRAEFSKMLINAFFDTMLEELKPGERHPDLYYMNAERMEALRQKALRAVDEKVKSGRWSQVGPDGKNMVAYLWPEVWGKDAFVYDSGSKMAIDIGYVEKKRHFGDLQFFRRIEKRYLAALSGSAYQEEKVQAFAGINFFDVSVLSKAQSVEHLIQTQIVPTLDPNEIVVVAIIGDGANDIPTMQVAQDLLKWIPSAVALPVYLSHDQGFADTLPAHAFVSLQERMQGAIPVLQFLNQIAGKKVSETGSINLSKWSRSEMRSLFNAEQMEIKHVRSTTTTGGPQSLVVAAIQGPPNTMNLSGTDSVQIDRRLEEMEQTVFRLKKENKIIDLIVFSEDFFSFLWSHKDRPKDRLTTHELLWGANGEIDLRRIAARIQKISNETQSHIGFGLSAGDTSIQRMAIFYFIFSPNQKPKILEKLFTDPDSIVDFFGSKSASDLKQASGDFARRRVININGTEVLFLICSECGITEMDRKEFGFNPEPRVVVIPAHVDEKTGTGLIEMASKNLQVPAISSNYLSTSSLKGADSLFAENGQILARIEQSKSGALILEIPARSETRAIQPKKNIPQKITVNDSMVSVTAMAQQIFSIQLLAGMTSSEFRTLFDGYFPASLEDRSKQINLAYKAMNLHLDPKDVLVLSPDLIQKHFLDDPRILNGQTTALYASSTEEMKNMQSIVHQKNLSGSVFVFNDFSLLKQKYTGRLLKAWIGFDAELAVSEKIKNQVPDYELLTLRRITGLLERLGFRNWAHEIRNQQRIQSAA